MKNISLAKNNLEDRIIVLVVYFLDSMMIPIRRLKSMHRSASVPIAALVAIFLYSTPAAAAPARCDVDIAGFKSYHGVCDFRAENGGSFSLRGKDIEFLVPTPAASYDPQESVFVKMVSSGIALLFGVGGAHGTGQYLATVYRQGACWVSKPPKDSFNGDARVCAK